MIKEIRSYFKGVIREIDSDYKSHDQYYSSSNISDSKIECTYFLKIGDMSSARIDTNYVCTFDVTLELWKNGKSDVIDNLDKAYCDAVELAGELQSQSRLLQTEFMKTIVNSGITSEAIDGDEKSGRFTLSFAVTTSYKA